MWLLTEDDQPKLVNLDRYQTIEVQTTSEIISVVALDSTGRDTTVKLAHYTTGRGLGARLGSHSSGRAGQSVMEQAANTVRRIADAIEKQVPLLDLTQSETEL